MRIYVDHTHLWRRITGLERITIQLFSKESLAPLDVVPVKAEGMGEMIAKQTLGLPAQLARAPSSLLLCPGFPPMPLLQAFGARVIPYIHDVFLLSRRNDLNWRARLYSAWPFSLAVRRLPRFMVNSADTGVKLAAYCREDADIIVYRPPAKNVFELTSVARAERAARPGVLRLVSLGTIEPRKNLLAAARIVAALRERAFPGVTLEIVGRRGWGDDWGRLSVMPGVTLRGYQCGEFGRPYPRPCRRTDQHIARGGARSATTGGAIRGRSGYCPRPAGVSRGARRFRYFHRSVQSQPRRGDDRAAFCGPRVAQNLRASRRGKSSPLERRGRGRSRPRHRFGRPSGS